MVIICFSCGVPFIKMAHLRAFLKHFVDMAATYNYHATVTKLALYFDLCCTNQDHMHSKENIPIPEDQTIIKTCHPGKFTGKLI